MYLPQNLSLPNRGGLTTTEIATARRPFLHTMPIPGCENYNAEYFASRKMSLQCHSLEEVIKETKNLLENQELQEQMIENQKKYIGKDTCDKIAEIILNTRGVYEGNC